jgi:hypothetical protein
VFLFYIEIIDKLGKYRNSTEEGNPRRGSEKDFGVL